MFIVQFKAGFFDRRRVTGAVDRTSRRALSRGGAFIRTSARSSIRTRRRASRPGQPPSSHSGLLRRWILFAYDPARKSVVIGAAALNGTRRLRNPVPSVLEFGGEARIGKRSVSIAARPYMRPAYEKERPKLPRRWAASISR
ncbi:hypothetical protein RAS1_42300 [Phycisphaerae bacterium RAS1]|nr:hypothetical protein RAS1_42300 [Phycisphaerae bacterium RAS1]